MVQLQGLDADVVLEVDADVDAQLEVDADVTALLVRVVAATVWMDLGVDVGVQRTQLPLLLILSQVSKLSQERGYKHTPLYLQNLNLSLS